MEHENEVKFTLGKNILFKGVDSSVLNAIALYLKRIVIESRNNIYQQGDLAEGLYLILSGTVRIFTLRDNESITLSEANDNHLFGEFLLAGDSIRTTGATAQTNCILYYLSIADFHQLSQQHPSAMTIIASRITKRLAWNETTLALRLSKLFVELNDDIVREIINELNIRSIPSNHLLIKPDVISKELFIVIHGRLQLRQYIESGQSPVIETIGRGETVCEKNVIGEYQNDAVILAIRDSIVASLNQASFEKILQRHPLEINRTLVKSIIGKLSDKSIHKNHSAETFAIIPLSNNLPASEISTTLSKELKIHGSTSVIDGHRVESSFHYSGIAQTTFTDSKNDTLLQWLSAQENAHRYVIYVVDPTLSHWSRRCIRQADHLLFVTRAEDKTDVGQFEQEMYDEIGIKNIKKTLILLHDQDVQVPSNTSQWLKPRTVDIHHHIRINNSSDYGRVARFLTGKAVGLVLGGGGARGFAHIGIIRALKELNIPIDLVGGNSMGAVVAAQCAMQWTTQRMISETQHVCVAGDEFTLPIASLFSGHKITQNLKHLFADIHIEDLWHPFYSVSCNISRAKVMTHNSGSLFSAVLNSNTPPGLFPPQVNNGDLLVDGALLNNVPVDIMRKLNDEGIIIAVDVNTREDLLNNANNQGGISGWKLLFNKFNPMSETIQYPNMIEILSRASIIGSLAQRKKVMSGIADLYLQPPLKKFSLRAYKQADKIAQKGYDYAIKELRHWQKNSNFDV